MTGILFLRLGPEVYGFLTIRFKFSTFQTKFFIGQTDGRMDGRVDGRTGGMLESLTRDSPVH